MKQLLLLLLLHLIFRSADPAYQSTIITDMPDNCMILLMKIVANIPIQYPNAAEFYRSWSGYGDELAWAAAWLLRATGEQRYQSDVERHFNEFDLSQTSRRIWLG